MPCWLISTISSPFLFPPSFSLSYGCRSLCTLQGRFPRVERHVAGVGESGEKGPECGCDANEPAGVRE